MGGKAVLLRCPAKPFRKNILAEMECVLPVVHGANVEDGTLQGLLQLLGVPYVGCGVAASALGMDKYAQKCVFRDNGIPVLDCVALGAAAYDAQPEESEAKLEALGFPLIVKPVNLGSSVGIGRVGDAEGLKEALEHAFQFADTVLAEPAVTRLRELNCSVLGDRESARASECEEPINSHVILSYEDKYMSGGGKAKGMSAAKRKLPADIPPDVRERIRELAVETFRLLGCNGIARVDFLMDADSGDIWVNEINTIPGSLSFYLWEPLGVSYTQLLDEAVRLAFKRRREEAEITYSFATNILAQFGTGGLKGAKGTKFE
jgi:D-alanine-D-alanine ligase